jgi:hypothetical protein
MMLVCAAGLVLAPAMAPAQEKPAAPARDTATLLFETPQWAKAPAGSTITYDYARQTYGTAEFGDHFDDTTTLKLGPGENAESRAVEVQLFSGARKRPAGPFESTTTNPVLLIIFEDNIQQLSRLFQANPLYLKSAIRRAWRSAAKIEDANLTVAGKSVAGTKITIHPFAGDAMKDHMHGLDGMTYVVELSDSIPGEIAAIDIHAPDEGALKFSETLRYKGSTP